MSFLSQQGQVTGNDMMISRTILNCFDIKHDISSNLKQGKTHYGLRLSTSIYSLVNRMVQFVDTNKGRHTAHTIFSWPNPKQWVIVHTSDLMMIIRQSVYILSIITKGMGKLKTHSPRSSMSSYKVCTMMKMRWCKVQTNEYDLQAKTYPTRIVTPLLPNIKKLFRSTSDTKYSSNSQTQKAYHCAAAVAYLVISSCFRQYIY